MGEKVKKILKVVYILWLRQLKRYYRSRSRIIGSLGQPLLFLVALGFGFGPIFEKAGGGDYIQFLAPGIIAMSIIFAAIFSGIEVIIDKQFGFLKETLVAPVPRWAIMLGRTLGGSTTAVFQGIVVLTVSLFIGFSPVISVNIVFSVFLMWLIAFIFTALGTFVGSLLDDMHAFPLIINFLIMPLFFLSGALFPLKSLPVAISFISSINPLSYGVDGLRGLLVNEFHFGIHLDILVLFAFAFIFLALGTYSFSRIKA